MKRPVLMTVLLLVLMAALSFPAAAQTPSLYEEQLSTSGGDRLSQQLPADVQELLEQLQVDVTRPESLTTLSVGGVLELLARLVQKQKSGPLQALSSLTVVTLLSAMFHGLEGVTDRLSLRHTYHTVSALAAGGLLLAPITLLMRQVQQAVESAGVFLLSFVPVYAGILAVSGNASAAVSYQTILLAAVEALGQLCRGAVLPLLSISLALGCTGAVTEGFSLSGLAGTVHKVILWALGLLTTVFSGVLGIQQMVAAAGDTVGRRAMKFSLSSFVPVVGNALSEAYSTVLGCAGLLRSAVGCFGVVATLLTVLSPLINCLVWSLCLHLGAGAAALFRLSALEKLCKTAAGCVRVLIAVLAVFALLMIVSTSVIAFAGKAA